MELVGKSKCLWLISVHGRSDFCTEKQKILPGIFSEKKEEYSGSFP